MHKGYPVYYWIHDSRKVTKNNRWGLELMFRYNDMYPLIEEWRNINKHHSELKAYAYTERSNFADQVASPFSEIQGKPLDCCPARNRMGNIAV